MKELKQIGYVHFYTSSESQEIYEMILDICSGIEQYVSAIRCNKSIGEIEFKYSPYADNYSVKCVFDKYKILLLDTYHPQNHIKFSGVGLIDMQRYNEAIRQNQLISVLFNKVHRSLTYTFTKFNGKRKESSNYGESKQ